MAFQTENLQAKWRELRAMVEQLAADPERYLELFERSADAYVLTDAAGVIAEVNGAAIDVLQRRRRQLLERPLAGQVALDCRADFRRRLGRLVAGEAQEAWRTVVESPGLRTEVEIFAQPITRGAEIGGVCWLLRVIEG